MSWEYLLLPRMEIQNANAQSTWWLINAAPVMAANLFAHQLGRKVGTFPTAVGIFHHHAQLLGEHFYARFHPQQRRGAVFINGDDYSSKNKYALSLQPTASCHLVLSLLLAFDSRDGLPATSKVEDFLHGARLAGGQILHHEPVKVLPDYQAVKRQMRGGYWLIERMDLLAEGDPLDKLIAVCGKANASSQEVLSDALPDSWLTPTTLGYAAITDFAQRGGVRDNYPHAYAEPLVGLVQYVSPRTWGDRPLPLWRSYWPQTDVFIVTQQEIAQ
jgi:CRISPR-associated protein Csy2